MSLEALRDELDRLEVDDPAIEPVAQAVLSKAPRYAAATNGLGRHYVCVGRLEEALNVYEAAVEADPNNDVAVKRVAALKLDLLKQGRLKAEQGKLVRRSPEEIVAGVAFGDHQVGCLTFMAWSIRAIKRIDLTRLAVTDLQSDARFRVVGGIYSAVTPYRGLLCISIDRRLGADVQDEVERSGGMVRDRPGPLSAVPNSIQLGVPYGRVSQFAVALERPHVEHLKQSILWGPPTWQHAHDDALERFILDAALGTASSLSSS